MSDDLRDRIGDFIRGADPSAAGDPAADDSFDRLARDAFTWQYERLAPYRRLCDARGATPATVGGWREVPTIPAIAFKSAELATAPAQETFRTSGTRGTGAASGEGDGDGERGVHHHPFPDLYRLTVDHSFPRYCLAGLGPQAPLLALIPDREQAPDSSLSFMVDHVMSRYGTPESAWAFGKRGIEPRQVRSWCGARQRAGRPCLVLATAFSLAQCLESLDRLGLRFRLPAGSAVFLTGGFKGRSSELTAGELAAAVGERLAVPAERIVGEYGMTELTSQLYTRALVGGDPSVFEPPPWVRVRVLDPATLEEAPAGAQGLIAIFDLANLGSAVHLLTEDLGVAAGRGVILAGRAAGAELRGCSLVAEELATGP